MTNLEWLWIVNLKAGCGSVEYLQYDMPHYIHMYQVICKQVENVGENFDIKGEQAILSKLSKGMSLTMTNNELTIKSEHPNK